MYNESFSGERVPMISCDTAKRMLSDYLEETLETDTKNSIREHLNFCPECKKVFADVRYLMMQIKSVSTVHVSANFDQYLRQRINNPQENKMSPAVRNLSYGFSGAVVIAGIAFFVVTNFFTQPEGTLQNSPGTKMSGMQPVQTQSPKPDNQLAGQAESEGDTQDADSLRSDPVLLDKDKVRLVDEKR